MDNFIKARLDWLTARVAECNTRTSTWRSSPTWAGWTSSFDARAYLSLPGENMTYDPSEYRVLWWYVQRPIVVRKIAAGLSVALAVDLTYELRQSDQPGDVPVALGTPLTLILPAGSREGVSGATGATEASVAAGKWLVMTVVPSAETGLMSSQWVQFEWKE